MLWPWLVLSPAAAGGEVLSPFSLIPAASASLPVGQLQGAWNETKLVLKAKSTWVFVLNFFPPDSFLSQF